MFENLTFNDGIFILLASFFLTIVISGIIKLPEEGWEKIFYVFEVYIIVTPLMFLGYSLLKQKSNNASYLTQERLFMGLFIVLISIVALVISMEILSQRKTKHGFLFFVSGIVGAIILLLAVLTNSALNQRYGLNYQDPYSMFEIGRYGALVDSYKN